MKNIIQNKDSLEFLKEQLDFDIDIIYCDPPYQLGSKVIVKDNGKIDYKNISDFMNKWHPDTKVKYGHIEVFCTNCDKEFRFSLVWLELASWFFDITEYKFRKEWQFAKEYCDIQNANELRYAENDRKARDLADKLKKELQ